jgi:hypothetical protein
VLGVTDVKIYALSRSVLSFPLPDDLNIFVQTKVVGISRYRERISDLSEYNGYKED